MIVYTRIMFDGNSVLTGRLNAASANQEGSMRSSSTTCSACSGRGYVWITKPGCHERMADCAACGCTGKTRKPKRGGRPIALSNDALIAEYRKVKARTERLTATPASVWNRRTDLGGEIARRGLYDQAALAGA